MTSASFDYDEFCRKYNKVKKLVSYVEKKQKLHRIKHIKIFKGFMRSKENRRAKQCVVKLISNLNKNGTKNALDYIIRNSDNNYAINERGEFFTSKDFLNEWSKDFSNYDNAKDTWHLVFSLDENNLNTQAVKALKSSVQELMQNKFFAHKYAMVTHTHQNKPHIHIVLNKRNMITKKKIHFNSKSEISSFFNEMREELSFNLKMRGLNYENKTREEKDLRYEFTKIQSKVEFKENYIKDELNLVYQKNKQSFENKYQMSEKKILILHKELEILDKKYDDLNTLFTQYLKHKNKRMYKIAKEKKELFKILSEKRKNLIKELRYRKTLKYKIMKINDDYLKHYKEKNDDLSMLKNYEYNFYKTYKNKTYASKADLENLRKVRRAIKLKEDLLDRSFENYAKHNKSFARLFNKDENLFNIIKENESIETNIYILKENKRLNWDNNLLDFLKHLEKNKEFLNELATERFNYVEAKLLKSEKIKKDDFLYKEYKKGCEFLNKESKIILRDEIKKDRVKTYSQNINKNNEKDLEKKVDEFARWY